MMKLLKKQRASSVLGLALDGNRLEAIVLRRSASGLQVKETAGVSLALSPLGGDPELVGREIRNHLDQAGIRERTCVVAIPASWVLTLQIKLPDLPESDLESLLQIEAERGFPSGNENLFITNSRARSADGENYATLIAISRNHLDSLDKALRAAQLKPVSFALGIAALNDSGRDAAKGGWSLAVGSNSVELEGSIGGGIIALRSLDGAVETAAAQKHVDTDLIAREIRITLGQLPPPLAENMRTVRIFARGDLARQFVSDITPRLQTMGLRVEPMDRASGADFSSAPPAAIALSPALAVAANYVRGVLSGPELLPPKVSQFQHFVATRVASKKFGWAAVGGGAAALIIGGAFIFQEVQLRYWEKQVKNVAVEAKDVKEARKQITKYRPWFDETFPNLTIWKTITDAFPQEGTVTAKSIYIRNLNEVTCSGITRDNQSYRTMFDKLLKTPGVRELNTDSLRGNQFTFKFRWEGVSSGN